MINLTTGPGGRFAPSDDDPKVPVAATNFLPPEPHAEHVSPLILCDDVKKSGKPNDVATPLA